MKIILVAVVIAVYLGSIRGYIEQYVSNSPIVIVKDLKKSTVTLSEVKVYLRRDSSEPWIEAGSMYKDESDNFGEEGADFKVEMGVYESPTGEWHGLTKVGADEYISKSEQHGSKVNFLWTATNNSIFMFLFRVYLDESHKNMQVGLDAITYEGRPEDPSIYSHTDSQIRNKEKRISECINVSKEILELQELDQLDENNYTKVTNGIFKVIVLTVFLKIVVFVGSFIVINRKIQEFYYAKKIVVKGT
ncbi:hypothetical protein NEOKW01_0501 [Nematocida sp. AWRm80]|nr:hypothetical protein NEOKW01_0501 [Nematocida sp. AWRm80]